MRIQTLQFLLVGWSWSLQWLWEDLVSYGQSFLQMGLVGSLQHLQKRLIVVGIRFTEASFWSLKYPAIFSDPSNPSRDIFNQMREKRNPPHPRMGEPQARSTPPNPGRVQEREWKTRVGISEINWGWFIGGHFFLELQNILFREVNFQLRACGLHWEILQLNHHKLWQVAHWGCFCLFTPLP